MSDKEKNVVLNFKMDGQVEYAKTIRDINAIMNAAAKEYRNHITAMGQDASATQKLAAEKKKLEIQMQAAKERTEMLRAQYEAMTKNSKTTTAQLAQMHGKLLDAERAEMVLEQAMQRVNDGLSEQAEESRKAQDALNKLEVESGQLETQTEKLNAQYELQVARLGENAKESEKLALQMEHLNKSHDTAKEKVENYEKQLEQAKLAYGENSSEIDKYETQLLEARVAEQQLANEIVTTNKQLKEQNDVLKKTSESLKAAGDKMKDVGKDLSMKVTAPIVAIGGVSAKAAIDFESAFAGVRKTVDASEAEFKQLEQGIRDMSKELPASASSIAEVAEAAGQLGIAKEDVLNFTRTMIDLGESTNMTSDEAATQIARFANIVGMSMDNVSNLGSTIVDLGNNSATTEAEIVALGMRIAAAGDQAGMSEANIMAISAAASSLGVEAEAGGTALSMAFTKITNAVDGGGKTLDAFAKASGITAKEFSKAWKEEPTVAFTALLKGLNNSAEAGKNMTSILDDLGIKGIREIDVIKRMSGAHELVAESIGIANNAWEEDIALSNEAAERYKTTESQLKMLKNSITDAAIGLGNVLIPMILKAVDVVKPWVEKFGEMDGSTQKLIVALGAVAAAIGPTLVILGMLTSSIGSIIGFVSTLSAALPALGGVLAALTGPVGLIVAAIVTLSAGLYALYQSNEQFRDFVLDVWEQIKEGFNVALEFIGSIVTTVMSEVTQFFSENLDKIKQFWNDNGEQIMIYVKFHLDQIWSTIQLVMGLIKGHFEMIWAVITGVTKIAWESIKLVVRQGIDLVMGIINTVLALIRGDWEGAWNSIKETVVNIWNNIVSFFESVNLVQIGKDIIQGLINGIGSMAEAVWEKAKSIADGIAKAIKETLGIASPSKVAKQIGLWTGEGLVIGLDESSPKVNKAMSDIGDGIIAVSKAYQKEYTNLIDDFNKKNEDKNDKALKKIYQIKNNAAKKKRALTKKELQDIALLEASYRDSKLKADRDFNKKYKALVEKSEKEYLEVIKKYVADKKSLDELSLVEEAAIWEQSIELFVEGTKERITAQKEYKKAVEAVNKELTSINKQYSDEMQKINDELIKQIDDLNKAYDDALSKRTQSLQTFKGTFDEFSWNMEKSGYDLIANLESQVEGFELWQKEMEKFAAKAVDEGLIAELREMGPKALPELLALNQLADEQLTQYSDLYQKKMSLAREQAETELVGMKEDTEVQIDELRKAANKKLDTLQQEWVKAIRKVTHGTSDEFKSLTSIGKQAGQNLLDGLSSMESALVSKARSIAAAVNSAMAGALGGTPSISTMSIDTQWNAKGGIFTQPTIFGASGGKLQGAGEAGPEAVLPLNDETLGAIGRGIAKTMGGANITINSRDDAESIARAVDRVVRRAAFGLG